MAPELMRDRMGAVVSDLLETDPKTALVLADISTDYFTRQFQKYPYRVVNVGIMEQTMLSLAAGLALEGFHPIVHSITPFVVERPFEQIKDDFCYQGLGGTLISVGASYDYGKVGMTHHGSADIPILKILPRMQCCVPGTADEFETLLRQTYNNGRRPTSAPAFSRTKPAALSPLASCTWSARASTELWWRWGRPWSAPLRQWRAWT
jgi:transketolase